MKKNSEMMDFALRMVGNPYWYGTYTQTATPALYAAKRAQYPSAYTQDDYTEQFGKRVTDCIGLVKGCAWSETMDSEPIYNRDQDVGTNGLYKLATEKGRMNTFPKHAGQLVFKGDLQDLYHVGVYVGNNLIVEAKGHAYGVVVSKLTSAWTYWCQCPWFEDDTGHLAVKAPFNMSYGDSGNEVKLLQMALAMRGYDLGRWGMDGEFYKATDKALREFQKDHGLEVDGVAGTQTWQEFING